jgi:parvulin-like peptidyl-prolyl isomerase
MSALERMEKAWSAESGDKGRETDLRLQSLRRLIEESLIVQAARRRGLQVSDEELDARVEEIKSDFPGRTFEDMLIKEYIGYEDWKERLRTQLLIRKMTALILRTRTEPDPEQWREFYNDRVGAAVEDRRYKVRHITVPDGKTAERVVKLTREGLSFGDSAARVLGDVAQELTGEAIWIYPDRLPAALARTVRSTPVGGVSDVVESDFGYTVFQVLDVEKVRARSPAEVMAHVRALYAEHQRTRAYEQWIEELWSTADLALNPELAKNISIDELKRQP